MSTNNLTQKNTKECILPVCDKPYHKTKENMPLGEELEKLWNYPLCQSATYLIDKNYKLQQLRKNLSTIVNLDNTQRYIAHTRQWCGIIHAH